MSESRGQYKSQVPSDPRRPGRILGRLIQHVMLGNVECVYGTAVLVRGRLRILSSNPYTVSTVVRRSASFDSKRLIM